MRIAEFSFDTLLYEGASTLVYGGIRESDGMPVVAKLVRDPRRNLTHEYLVLQKVVGSRVVVPLGLFDGSDGPVLVEHRYGTGSLADVVRKGRFAVPRALRVALQLAHACTQVHAARIVHRDIKPANVLYEAESEAVTLCDFGSAAELPVNGRALPVGDLVGTPAYLSPEHTGRTREGCDARSDLYSLGITLYEMLTGAVPFAEAELLDVVAAHLSKMPEAPHVRVASIPPVLSEIVMKLLAKLPDERYQSAHGLAADLERCLETIGPDGRIASFELGRSDLLRPRFPPRLFGRGDELRRLEQALARARSGAPTLVLISGREGSGRSELVRALIRDVAIDSHLALGGWSAAHERPLSGLGDALGSLAQRLLVLEEDHLAALRREFSARAGRIGQVVLDVAPQLGDVLGPQPDLVELATVPARARLHHGLRCLVSALGDEAPFVLALRGFEHADAASSSVIEAILDNPMSSRVLVVVMAHEPGAFGALRDRSGAVSIELAPLAVEAIAAWTAVALDGDVAHTAELAAALHTRSAGNPLMFKRLLEHLVETGVIARRESAYVWSLDAVREAPPPPTLGALASQRIAELDAVTRRTLAATACGEDPIEAAAVAAMLDVDAATAARHIAALARECLVAEAEGGYRPAHAVIAETALVATPPDEIAVLRARLGAHLLAASGPAPTGAMALRVAMALSRGELDGLAFDRVRAAEHHVIAAEYVTASTAYEVAAALLAGAAALLASVADDPWQRHRALQFRIELGRARALMMLGDNAGADAQLAALAQHDLSPSELGLLYVSWCDNRAMVMDRARAVEIGLEGLARLGIRLPAHPSALRPLAAIRLTQRHLARQSADDHIRRPWATDARAIAALQLLGTLTLPVLFTGRMGLYVLIAETAIGIVLRHGHVRNMAGFLAVHACFLHAMRGDYQGARRIYEACAALDQARPAPELAARTYVVFHYMVTPWFGAWQDAAAKLQSAIRLGVEAGDPVFAALCASASITMLNLVGTPLDRLVATVEAWAPFLRGDGGVAANAANVVNIAGKLSRGEPITRDDLDRVSNVPLTAGSMRHNAMVNLGLALAVVGHEAQVRAWLDEIRDRFPQTNFAQPHRMTLWLLDGLFAAKDARTGKPERRADAERILETFRMLRRETEATNNDPAIALLEAQLARLDDDLDRAAGQFARAARDARARDLTPIVAYATEERARMLEDAGYPDEATLFYREAVFAYRRWGHFTKAIELEQVHPAVRVRDLTSDDRRTLSHETVSVGVTGTLASTVLNTPAIGQRINEQLDLVTVLKVSQEISTQLTGSGVVRAVLSAIAQNTGAERVVFVLRAASGVETVYGEFAGGSYRDVGVPAESYAALPRSVIRVVRRSARPHVVADAIGDPGCASDRFVVESRCRSIAGIPVRGKGEVLGYVVLENRMVAGAFTPQRVSLTQALVAQAAISLDNATLYHELSALNRELEARVEDRTRALQAAQQQLLDSARKAGMADVAVEVLHNVGNALNSVNVSAQLIEGQVAGSKAKTVARVAELLDDHKHDLAAFFTTNPRGAKVVETLSMLGGALSREQDAMRGELRQLRSHVDDIIAVIHELNATSADKGTAILEAPAVVLDEAVAAIAERGDREHIAISTACDVLPGTKVDKHKGLSILGELLANAFDALADTHVDGKRIEVRVRETRDAVVFQVIDNGVGISSENLPRIFRGGFTGKADRRGDHLHRSANSATSAGGSVTAESGGPGCGATFTLVLPNRGARPGDDTGTRRDRYEVSARER